MYLPFPILSTWFDGFTHSCYSMQVEEQANWKMTVAQSCD